MNCKEKLKDYLFPLLIIDTVRNNKSIRFCFTIQEVVDQLRENKWKSHELMGDLSKLERNEVMYYMKHMSNYMDGKYDIELCKSCDCLDVDKYTIPLQKDLGFGRSVYTCDDCDTVLKKIEYKEGQSKPFKELFNGTILGENVRTPKVTKYCHNNEAEYIEFEKGGESVLKRINFLSKTITNIRELEKEIYPLLLECYNILKSIHNQGYIHDDPHLGNFIFMEGDEIGVIDIEGITKIIDDQYTAVDFVKFYSSFALTKVFKDIYHSLPESSTIRLMKEVVCQMKGMNDFAVRMILTRNYKLEEQARVGMELYKKEKC